MAGTHDTSVRSYRFYTRAPAPGAGPALTVNFSDCKLIFIDKEDGRTNFVSQGIIISNDSLGNEIQFSFDGVTVEGDLMAQETMNFFALRRKHIYLRGQAGAEAYRLWAW
jgi:hypothetical protein